MKKLWRSGMIDKRVVERREQAEYINKLHMVVNEFRREQSEPEYAILYTSDNRSYKVKVAKEVNHNNNVVLDLLNWYMENRPKYDRYDTEKILGLHI